jgi:DNA-binding response OmpR family regulator
MKKILIAEDEVDIRFILKEILETLDFELHEASDGEEAVKAALEIKPDILLLDISMPKLTGYEVAKKLKQNNINTKIIMLSAKAQKDDVVRGLEAGADYYITKPFDLNELLITINGIGMNV